MKCKPRAPFQLGPAHSIETRCRGGIDANPLTARARGLLEAGGGPGGCCQPASEGLCVPTHTGRRHGMPLGAELWSRWAGGTRAGGGPRGLGQQNGFGVPQGRRPRSSGWQQHGRVSVQSPAPAAEPQAARHLSCPASGTFLPGHKAESPRVSGSINPGVARQQPGLGGEGCFNLLL